MLHVKTAATEEPVSVAEAKSHLRVTHAEDDALIGRLITGARDHLEQVLGRALADSEFIYAGSLSGLPIWPGTIQNISGLECDGVTWTPLSSGADYNYNAETNRIEGSNYRVHRVEFAAVPGEVPQAIRDAILLRVQADYEESPDDSEKLRDAADRMAYPYRIFIGA